MNNSVELYLYDLSEGWCKNLGPLCPVNAIWHTSIVFCGKEYVFGGRGIQFHNPAKPLKIVDLGQTSVTAFDFKMYVKELKYTTWTAASYDPLEHNCNHFTDHIAKFLGFDGIPGYVFQSVYKLRKSPFYSKMIDLVSKHGQNKELE